MKQLSVIVNTVRMGRVFELDGGALSFEYDPKWLNAPAAYPLSLSMPLTQRQHPHERIEVFLWNLLPENDRIIGRWAQRLGVSALRPFALLERVGEDCPGTLQFVKPEREDAVAATARERVQWLEEDEICERLKELRQDAASWRRPGDIGQFTLAGAQAKIALLKKDGDWGIPSGRTPTTHIIKPSGDYMDGYVENEHFCLSLAASAGLPVADSSIERFGDETAIVITRFDRVMRKGRPVRLHTEDFCQTLSIPPTRKYQKDGGPAPADVAGLLLRHTVKWRENLQTFVDALAFNWLIGGFDAHAKNYTLFIGEGGGARLAPFYDLTSVLPYPTLDVSQMKLAMKIGNEYEISVIAAAHWKRMGDDLGLDGADTVERVRKLAETVFAQIPAVDKTVRAQGLKHPILDRLVKTITARVADCQRMLDTQTASGF